MENYSCILKFPRKLPWSFSKLQLHTDLCHTDPKTKVLAQVQAEVLTLIHRHWGSGRVEVGVLVVGVQDLHCHRRRPRVGRASTVTSFHLFNETVTFLLCLVWSLQNLCFQVWTIRIQQFNMWTVIVVRVKGFFVCYHTDIQWQRRCMHTHAHIFVLTSYSSPYFETILISL